MWHQASVETGHSFFLGDQSEALEQACIFRDAVLERGLAQAGSDDLDCGVISMVWTIPLQRRRYVPREGMPAGPRQTWQILQHLSC